MDRASSQYGSFSGKMVLKRLFHGDTGKALALHAHCLGLSGGRPQAILLWTGHQVNMVVLVAR